MEAVNKRLRQIRKMKNITLKELSEKTDLSASFISQVERGISSITITSLKKIADALEVSMKELFEVEEPDSYMRKANNGVLAQLENSYTSHVRLSGKFDNRKLEAIILRLTPESTTQGSFEHEGEEFYYVTKGKAIFVVGDKEYLVSTGESIHFPSNIPHTVNNPFKDEFEAVSVLTPTIF